MILVRDIFQLKFGKAKEAKALWKEAEKLAKQFGSGPERALTDLTGPYYTFVMEGLFENLAAYEQSMKDTMGEKEWSAWYQKFVPLIESGRLEIFTIVE